MKLFAVASRSESDNPFRFSVGYNGSMAKRPSLMFRLLEVAVVVAVLAILWGLCTPAVQSEPRPGARMLDPAQHD